MWNLLAKVILVMALVLMPPTGLVLASQDAVPGDNTYPVKRGLEGVILKIASLNPRTKAFFDSDLSERRYKEAITLMSRGNSADESLVELAQQTQAAAIALNQVSDPVVKQQLAQTLSEQINEYKKGLQKVQKSQQQVVNYPATRQVQPTIVRTETGVVSNTVSVPQPAKSLAPTSVPIKSGSTPAKSEQTSALPTPTSQPVASAPLVTPLITQPAIQPQPTISQPVQISQPQPQTQPETTIDETIDELTQIQKDLPDQSSSQQGDSSKNNQGNGRENGQDNNQGNGQGNNQNNGQGNGQENGQNNGQGNQSNSGGQNKNNNQNQNKKSK